MAFLRHKSTGFRCAVACPSDTEWAAMFLRSVSAVGISGTGLLFESEIPDAYGGRFADLRQPQYQNFVQYPEAVLQLPDHTDGSKQYMFITGTESLAYRVGAGAVQHDQLAMLTWLPADWQQNVDALVQAPNSASGAWRTYLFKGNRVITHDWNNIFAPVERNVLITEGPDANSPGWAQLPADFRADLDHVVALPLASDGVRRSLLVKGTSGLILNWQTGVEASGPLTSLTTGLGSLPTRFATPYLPLSGTYRATNTDQTVEARVDVDCPGTLSTISGDLFSVASGTTAYTNSFRSTSVKVEWSTDYVVLTGTALTWATAQPALTRVRILIPFTEAGRPPRAAGWLTVGARTTIMPSGTNSPRCPRTSAPSTTRSTPS